MGTWVAFVIGVSGVLLRRMFVFQFWRARPLSQQGASTPTDATEGRPYRGAYNRDDPGKAPFSSYRVSRNCAGI